MKAVSGYSSNQTSGVAHNHGWHSATHPTSKQHGYGTSASQWSSRGTAASATVSARSEWPSRGSTAASGGVGSSYVLSAKNTVGIAEPSRSAAMSASARATHEPRYDAYASAAARRY